MGIGILLILGLMTLPALITGTLMMIILMTGMCALQKWDIVALQMSYVLFYAISIYFLDKDRFSLDSLRHQKNFSTSIAD